MLAPYLLQSGDRTLDDAYRLALADLRGNVMPFQDGLLAAPAPCIMAGLHYGKPWTRDASINSWNGAGLILPDATRNTLLSVLTRDAQATRIGGQYWDAIIWVAGAWAFYLQTGDRDFLALAHAAARDSLAYFERTEFDPARGLFRGGACFADGVAAYPDRYTNPGYESGIDQWPALHPDRRHAVGEGLPAMTLSTNCLYYQAYLTAAAMATELGLTPDPRWEGQARALRDAINRHFWDQARGGYAYLLDDAGVDFRQEGLGIAFAILFGIAGPERAARLLQHVHTTPHGIACLWPTYDRYATRADTFGRHSGTVWPHVNAFWADAAATQGRRDLAYAELRGLARLAMRDLQFAEIYHPQTGAIYGGLQENEGRRAVTLWASRPRQTWCATGFLRMVWRTLLGGLFTPNGLKLAPWLPEDMTGLHLKEILYRETILDIKVERSQDAADRYWLNGKATVAAHVPADIRGRVNLTINLGRERPA